MRAQEFPIVFTDLDGTLLDHHTYKFDAACEALADVKARSIPIILNTSKTIEESIALSSKLNICHPVIVENGSAIILPAGYSSDISIQQNANWHDEPTTLTLGATREAIRSVLTQADERLSIKDCYESFSSMGDEEIMRATDLAIEDARQANNRQYSEPLIWHGNDAQMASFSAFLLDKGYQIIRGGRFHHVIGNSNKRTAMEHLVSMYRNGAKNSTKLIVIALGDGANDLSMLSGADIAVLVRNDTQPTFDFEHPNLMRTTQYGPAGWQEAMQDILSRL